MNLMTQYQVRMFFVTDTGRALFFGKIIPAEVGLETLRQQAKIKCAPFKVLGFAAWHWQEAPYADYGAAPEAPCKLREGGGDENA